SKEKADSMDAVDSEGHNLPNGQSADDREPLEQSKSSKKRKREADDESGKELIDGVEKMSFKERSKAEKKARKAEKAAKKAKMLQTLEELNSQTL
ncbi:16834_t:CDS:1, partial [Acaulospora colombiana]